MNTATKLISTMMFRAIILLGVVVTASANPFPTGDAQVGQKLFAKYDCNQCHNSIMGGDGNKIFTR